jgi:hypothetical protein
MSDQELCTCCTCGYEWRTGQDGSHSCSKYLKAKLDAQSEELAALRAFAKAVIEGGYQNNNAYVFGLIDADGKPTPLLTGENLEY